MGSNGLFPKLDSSLLLKRTAVKNPLDHWLNVAKRLYETSVARTFYVLTEIKKNLDKRSLDFQMLVTNSNLS